MDPKAKKRKIEELELIKRSLEEELKSINFELERLNPRH